MAISYTITPHKVAFPSKVAASAGSPHIYNVRLSADHDNGDLIGRGAWVAFDEYAEAAAPNTFKGVIRGQGTFGWYVEVTAATDALFVFNSPVIAEDYNKKFSAEKNFYNKTGDTVKAYGLIVGDVYEISADGFTGTPQANKNVTYASGKYVVASGT